MQCATMLLAYRFILTKGTITDFFMDCGIEQCLNMQVL